MALGLLGGVPSAQAYTVKQTDSGATVRWHTNGVSLRLDPSMQNYFRDIPVRDVVGNAAQAWHNLPGVPELMLNEGMPGPRGYDAKSGTDNGVYLIEDWQLAESSLAVTVATFETKSGKIVDTDILVNAKHPFALLANGPDEPADDFDIRGVLTHEMGHVLGLGESYDVRMATMWPNVARGETHQRDLDEDDIDGVETAYAMAIAADTASSGGSSGCGGASVVARRPHGGSAAIWLLAGSGLVIAGLWMRMRARNGRGRGAPLFAMVLLFGAPFKSDTSDPSSREERVEVLRTLALRRAPLHERRAGLAIAARSTSQQVRMAAAAVLERSGVREDGALAAELTQDADSEVRRVATLALERLRTAPPADRIAADEPQAKKRLSALLDGADDVLQGEAVRTGARMDRGLIWSKYQVHDADRTVEVEIPGGQLGEYTQVVSEHETPGDGNHVVVATHAKGRHTWAFLRDGVVYGGALGDGPAIRWQ
ncbi:MAG TPA: matrixin family metalloprotease [Polyangiales bacterium]